MMRIPARFIKYAATHSGASSKEGFIEIDIRALDLDGVTKLYVNLDDVSNVRQKREGAMGTLEAWDAMFGEKEE
jgi:hypothetical protein